MTTALGEGGIEARIRPNRGTAPVRVAVAIDPEQDLGTCGKAVSEANTPHRSQSAPGLALVLFAELSEQSAQAAQEALQKIKGVDAGASKVDAKKGEISVRIVGGEKVTAAGIQAALKEAGIEAAFTKRRR